MEKHSGTGCVSMCVWCSETGGEVYGKELRDRVCEVCVCLYVCVV